MISALPARVARWIGVVLLLTVSAGVIAAPVPIEVQAPDPLRALLAAHLALAASDTAFDDAERDRALRSIRQQASDLLATEGYFEPQLEIDVDTGPTLRVSVEPGRRVVVSEVELRFAGAIADAGQESRRQALRDAWALPAGRPFRQEEWEQAKRRALAALLAEDYAAAQIADSRAEIDPETATARLGVSIDSGPAFTLGAIEIDGLKRYDADLVGRYISVEPGQRYSQERLAALQRALQNAPYFSSVVVEIDPDPARAAAAPVRVRVTEARPKRLSFGAGVSSNNGPRLEATYRDANILDRAWLLVGGLRIDSIEWLAYADIHLPPTADEYRDSFGVLGEDSDDQGLKIRRSAFGVVRARVRERLETRVALNYQQERREVDAGDSSDLTALTLNWSWTWRHVDDMLNPRRGLVLSAQLGGGSSLLLSDRTFLRGTLRAQNYWPVGERDVLMLRAEAGWTAASSRSGVPEEFLFRTGGSESVRGYEYESIGVREDDAIVGGRYLVTASVEYVHWLSHEWGGAAFFDAGQAADATADMRPLLRGYGLGARWRSPAGPLGIDFAWSERDEKLRPSFSIAIAF